MVQSPMFDGRVPHWYHQMCFFGKQRPRTVADIADFDSLRWEDQEKIRKKIENASGGGAAVVQGSSTKGRKKAAAKGGMLDFLAEYAKSGRAKCRGCEDKILKDEVRISKKEFDSESAKMYGPVDQWHHVDCFIKKRAELEFFESADMLPGFNTLSADDKKMLKEKLKKIEVKRKAEDEPDIASKKIKTEDEEAVRKQSKKMFKYRDGLSKTLNKKELSFILEHNNHYIPSGESKILDAVVDIMTFGAFEPCEVCKEINFRYVYGQGYVCKGNLTEWTKCTNVVKEPKRQPFLVPEELKSKCPILDSYKFKSVGKRIWIDHGPTTAEVIEKKENNTALSQSRQPLDGMSFVIVGSHFSKDKNAMKNKIKELGGKVTTKVDKTTTAVITTKDLIGGTDKKIDTAKTLNVHCVSEDFLDEVDSGGALLMIEKKSIAPWGGNLEDKVHSGKSSTKSSTLDSRYVKSMPEKQKIKLKGGAAVDPDSGLEDSAHVYQRGGKLYNSVLGMVNVVKGTNSYYKLQVLENDDKRRWWVFRSWGRIGTTIGNNKLEEFEDLNDAISQFQGLYEEKTGNQFTASEFKKKPSFWYPLDIDYGQDEIEPKLQVAGSKSKLPKSIQELVALIFDVGTMKKSMLEFEIDVKKMPLGKLSKKQIQDAYKVLSEALELIQKLEKKPDGEASDSSAQLIKTQLLDCSNRFYTLIPHDFGMKKPPLLDDVELIKTKIGMLDNLSEIEVAYSLLKSEGNDDKDADPIDKHYHKLKTKVNEVDKKGKEYKMIQDYVSNTHATTHSHYKLIVEEVFKIEREGEKKRYKPFKQLHNRKLLWHGSRLTNFAGILSQGLRIAPPEAPVTGYMFGKGVYFADMVSKSANYCSTSQSNPTGLILLCEVALGEMYERTQAEYVEKLPKGKHSTKGMGRNCPDPSQALVLEDGVEVPLGKGVPSNVKNSSLLYNEYIVYDVAQINAKYLLKLNFKYKY
nr:poly [ADP-ribose] polymerase 1-like [Cherax quadricarinatus]